VYVQFEVHAAQRTSKAATSQVLAIIRELKTEPRGCEVKWARSDGKSQAWHSQLDLLR